MKLTRKTKDKEKFNIAHPIYLPVKQPDNPKPLTLPQATTVAVPIQQHR